MAQSKWEEVKEKLILVQGWARNGLTNEQIANNLGIDIATLYRYKNQHNEFCEVLKRNKDMADIEIENALFNKALNGDTTAMIFWLKNRQPTSWRDKREIQQEVTGETTVNNNMNLSNLTIEQMKELLKDD